MATVNYAKVFISLATDLGNPIAAFSTGFQPQGSTSSGSQPGSDTRVINGSVRQYANGRYRWVSMPGVQRQFSVTMRLLTWSQCYTLDAWIGNVCLFRDRIGRRIYGVMSQVVFGDYKGDVLHDATITFNEVSYDESV